MDGDVSGVEVQVNTSNRNTECEALWVMTSEVTKGHDLLLLIPFSGVIFISSYREEHVAFKDLTEDVAFRV